MSLLRRFEDPEYRPIYGTLTVRDVHGATPPAAGDLLTETTFVALYPPSTAIAGAGFVRAAATDIYHTVVLESYDVEPEADPAGWADMVELPYLSGGTVAVTWVTGGDGQDPFRLGPAGAYRLRFSRRPAEDGDLFRLQYWPVAASEPPRWLARSAAWVLDDAPDELRRYGAAATDLVLLAIWAAEGSVAVTRSWLSERALSDPDTTRTVLDYLRRAGPAQVDGDLDDPAAPLTITVAPYEPPRFRSRPVRADRRFEPATDPSQQAPATPRGGGSSMLQPGAVIRRVTATRGGPAGGIAISLRGGPPDEFASIAIGSPPRAGYWTEAGTIVQWRDGVPATIATWSDRGSLMEVWQTRHGVIAVRSGAAALIRRSGEITGFGAQLAWPAAVDPQGELFAAVESHIGRKTWSRLYLVDLADGTRHQLPGPTHEVMHWIAGVYDGVVYCGLHGERSLAWRPGSDPVTLPYTVTEVDRYSGALLAHDDAGPLVVRPGGAIHRIDVTYGTQLVPGGGAVMSVHDGHKQVKLVALDDPAAEPVVHQLPGRSRMPPRGGAFAPVWEDATHLLVLVEGDGRRQRTGVRLDVVSGELTLAPLPDDPNRQLGFVWPLVEPGP